MQTQQKLRVIGVDPGPVPGVVVLVYVSGELSGVQAFQCMARSAADLVSRLIVDDGLLTLVQAETFVVGRRSARSSTARAGAVTRDLVGQIERVTTAPGRTFTVARYVSRSAAQVKPWATDARLKAVQVNGSNLLDQVGAVGRHARDAARHALFCAVKDGGIPDPLSKASTSKETAQ